MIETPGAPPSEVHRNGACPVLVVGEAKLASPTLLEEIRLLKNHEDRQDMHLRVVLDVADDQK